MTTTTIAPKSRRCTNPMPVTIEKVLANGVTGPRVFCTGCDSFQPASQVVSGKELRNAAGSIVGSYAALPH